MSDTNSVFFSLLNSTALRSMTVLVLSLHTTGCCGCTVFFSSGSATHQLVVILLSLYLLCLPSISLFLSSLPLRQVILLSFCLSAFSLAMSIYPYLFSPLPFSLFLSFSLSLYMYISLNPCFLHPLSLSPYLPYIFS